MDLSAGAAILEDPGPAATRTYYMDSDTVIYEGFIANIVPCVACFILWSWMDVSMNKSLISLDSGFPFTFGWCDGK